MNLYVQWFIIASEDAPNLCIELFINATGIESYFMKGVFMNFITYLAIYDCILACTLYMKYLWPAGKKNVKLWWSMDNIKVLVGTNKLWILIHSLSLSQGQHSLSLSQGQTYGGLLKTLIMLSTEMVMFTICVLVITDKGKNQTCCTVCRVTNLKGWLKELLT